METTWKNKFLGDFITLWQRINALFGHPLAGHHPSTSRALALRAMSFLAPHTRLSTVGLRRRPISVSESKEGARRRRRGGEGGGSGNQPHPLGISQRRRRRQLSSRLRQDQRPRPPIPVRRLNVSWVKRESSFAITYRKDRMQRRPTCRM